MPTNVPLNQIQTLITRLNAACAGEWAFSGSFALWLYANERDVAFRLPGDVDILVTNAGYMAGTDAYYSGSGTSFKEMGTKGWTAPFVPVVPGLDIDWIVERADRGKLKDCHLKHFHGLGIVPIIKLEALGKLKAQMTNENTDKGRTSQTDLELIAKLQ